VRAVAIDIAGNASDIVNNTYTLTSASSDASQSSDSSSSSQESSSSAASQNVSSEASSSEITYNDEDSANNFTVKTDKGTVSVKMYTDDTPEIPKNLNAVQNIGVVDFSAVGVTSESVVNFKVVFPVAVQNALYLKLKDNQWSVYQNASCKVVGSTTECLVRITDNGEGDSNPIAGIVNDPATLGYGSVAVPISNKSLIILSLLMALASFVVLGRREKLYI
jgi:hypothetical protein